MQTSDTVWICYEASRSRDAIALATRLRRRGVPVDMLYGGKLKNQTKKARSENPLALVTLFADLRNTIKRRWDEAGRELSQEEIQKYLAWQAEDDTPLPDPIAVLQRLGDNPVIA